VTLEAIELVNVTLVRKGYAHFKRGDDH